MRTDTVIAAAPPSKQRFSILRTLFSPLTISHIHRHAGERGSGWLEGGRWKSPDRWERYQMPKDLPRQEGRKKERSRTQMGEWRKRLNLAGGHGHGLPSASSASPDKNLRPPSPLPTRGSIQRALYSVLFNSPAITYGVPVRISRRTKRKTGSTFRLSFRNSKQNMAGGQHPVSALLGLSRPRTERISRNLVHG